MRHTGGLLRRAVSMVVQLENYVLEARFWIVGVWHSISHVHQTSLRGDADASKQVGEPGIGAKGVPERLYFKVSETIQPLLVSPF
jgi:hypothetical protein